MRFELVELYLENSLFLLKACLCNDRVNAQNQQGSRRAFFFLFFFFALLAQKNVLTSSGTFAFNFNFHACIFTSPHVCVCVKVS